jgi:hypothetical protein
MHPILIFVTLAILPSAIYCLGYFPVLLRKRLSKNTYKEAPLSSEKKSFPPEKKVSSMSLEEAFSILGLPPDAQEHEIQESYRYLMKKLHPDHGGSNHLAHLLNEAKSILMTQRHINQEERK